jgi:hypothetical protein
VSLPPESIQVGQCYLMSTRNIVRRVLHVLGDGKLMVETRKADAPHGPWRTDMLTVRFFVSSTERPVPCDWTPETDE